MKGEELARRNEEETAAAVDKMTAGTNATALAVRDLANQALTLHVNLFRIAKILEGVEGTVMSPSGEVATVAVDVKDRVDAWSQTLESDG